MNNVLGVDWDRCFCVENREAILSINTYFFRKIFEYSLICVDDSAYQSVHGLGDTQGQKWSPKGQIGLYDTYAIVDYVISSCVD